MYMGLLMLTGVEIWIREDLQVGMCLAYLEELWMSKKQAVVALSTIEVEYMAATHANKEVVWLQSLCSEIGFKQQVVRIDCDNQSAIFLAKKPAHHSKMKLPHKEPCSSL